MHPSVTDQHLLLWYFEDWLKKYFFSILHILEVSRLGSSHPCDFDHVVYSDALT
jgi:hypothetical protein